MISKLMIMAKIMWLKQVDDISCYSRLDVPAVSLALHISLVFCTQLLVTSVTSVTSVIVLKDLG